MRESGFVQYQERVTPEFVLEVLRDEHRQLSQVDDCVDPDVELTFETTITEWRHACDLLPWRPLGRAENKVWGMELPDKEWKRALTPGSTSTLRNVCELIASYATRPAVRPVMLFGKPCLAAGAFLAVRSMLERDGADVRKIAPSTALEPYLRAHLETFLGPISMLAPGALPAVKVRWSSNCDFGTILLVVSVGLFIAGCLTSAVDSLVPSALLLVGVMLLMIHQLFVHLVHRPASLDAVQFGELRTFRDLAELLSRLA